MTVTSFYFFLLLAVGVLLYYLLPHRIQWVVLTVLSVVFYFAAATPYTMLFLLAATLITYGSTLYISARRTEDGTVPKLVSAVAVSAIFLNTLLWFLLKGSSFWILGSGLIHRAVPAFPILPALPWVGALGMGYYTAQVIGYILDVLWGTAPVQRNPLKLFLFVSFFPQLTVGPISRYQDFSKVYEPHAFSYENICFGTQRILWGLFKKLVIADRVGVIISSIWAESTAGLWPWIAVFLYPLQIYTDFSGCMDIVLGAARILGYDLIENFQSPFEARTFNDFWRRWHISMTSWFRDYVYFSLGGSRCAPWRHYLNIVIVFVCSGLWHGADWRYLAWGLFTGLLAAFGVMTARARQRINRYNPLYRMGWFKVFWQCLFTNALFCLTLVFFASAIYNTDPFAVYGSLLQGWDGLTGSWAQVSNLIYSSGIDGRLPVVLLFGCFVVFAAEHKGRSVARWIRQQVWPLRWTLYYGMAAAILFFAAFGQSAFIYQQY